MNRRRWLDLPGGRDLVAAWWSASLRASSPLRLMARLSPPPIVWAGTGVAGSLGLAGCATLEADEQRSSMEMSLEAQREQGWTVGEPAALQFPDWQELDVAGSADWRQALSTLPLRLTPAEPRWLPFYDPTLFQSLQAPRNIDLRFMMQPVFSPAMAIASRRGEALLSLFVENGCRNDVALVLDIPGPEAVALAAALAPCFDPVFAFDNWPHPRGVVPSHLTLGAALYYLPWFERERTRRPPDAAPVFVLDRQRLAPYADEIGRFDNRYFAALPPREAFAAAGIRHILYVTPDAQVQAEADDLNDDLVGLDRAGIDVRLLALSDFSETPLPGWLDEDEPPTDPPPSWSAPQVSFRFYFGGSARSHACFWDWYGWRGRPPATGAAPSLPHSLRARALFQPTPRTTFRFGGVAQGRSGSMGRSHFGGLSG